MKDTFKVVVVGPGGAGKTKGTITLMQILQSIGFETSRVNPWNETMVTTSNFVVHNFTVPKSYFSGIEDEINIVLYDLGGQFKYEDMWLLHSHDTDAIVVVVDMTRRTTLHQVGLMLPHGILGGVPVRLLVNKADLYDEFSESIPVIVNQIETIIKDTIDKNLINYTVRYRNEEKFIFNSRVYQYGDRIDVMRQLNKDNDGNPLIKIADLEAIVTLAFKTAMPSLTDHNSYLFGREFTLQAFDKIYKLYDAEGTVLSNDLIIQAHNEAPPFFSYGNDPDIFLPLTILSRDVIQDAVESMIITDVDLIEMIEELKRQKFNIDISQTDAWAFTSAIIFNEDPEISYKPMHKAILPPFFIKSMVQYQTDREAELDKDGEYFV